ncbi:zinc-dependent metalloprotease [Arthrobacter sp. H35-D1]|uniref:zinc-dependent metalloprotease n=1 Tax=Arthrobacter sp. H35-D1 TaxID=3046202 RepID=UPI0024BB8A54|nr:zinc-dependent metalloprotease [Arthrobacter sp. H35-D1]MDJ0312195.1 zinc-dependent metalloprotease [Arthrobacter sp. H35-D1]
MTQKSSSAAVAPAPPAMVNWELAARTAANLAPAGPALSGSEISAAVENLRLMAERSVPHVHEISRLEAARDLHDSQVLVVDRASWAKANTQSFAVMLDPVLRAVAAKQAGASGSGSAPAPGSPGAAFGATVTGAQLGGALAFLSSKVLGQYDPFAALAPTRASEPHAAGGRLLLVAPNIITVERELKVDPSDFRLWVCLHEQTHRVQFAAAPWLRHHMLAEIEKLGALLVGDSENLGERLLQSAKQLGGKHAKDTNGGEEPHRGSVLDLLQDPAQKAALSHLTAVMSLLEGHANVVMDGVDKSIVPTVRTIRQRFNNRGKDRGVIEKFMRNLMGLDAKMRQYSDGAKFVRDTVDVVGMDGFNNVWTTAENLPTEKEIHNARLWVERMGL